MSVNFGCLHGDASILLGPCVCGASGAPRRSQCIGASYRLCRRPSYVAPSRLRFLLLLLTLLLVALSHCCCRGLGGISSTALCACWVIVQMTFNYYIFQRTAVVQSGLTRFTIGELSQVMRLFGLLVIFCFIVLAVVSGVQFSQVGLRGSHGCAETFTQRCIGYRLLPCL